MKVQLQQGVEVDGVAHTDVMIRGLTVRQGLAVQQVGADLKEEERAVKDLDDDEVVGLVRTAWRTWLPSLGRHLQVTELLDLQEVDFGVLMDACREVSKSEATFRKAATAAPDSVGGGGEDDRVE